MASRRLHVALFLALILVGVYHTSADSVAVEDQLEGCGCSPCPCAKHVKPHIVSKLPPRCDSPDGCGSGKVQATSCSGSDCVNEDGTITPEYKERDTEILRPPPPPSPSPPTNGTNATAVTAPAVTPQPVPSPPAPAAPARVPTTKQHRPHKAKKHRKHKRKGKGKNRRHRHPKGKRPKTRKHGHRGHGSESSYPAGSQPGYPTGAQTNGPAGPQPGYPTGAQSGYPTGTPGAPAGSESSYPTDPGTSGSPQPTQGDTRRRHHHTRSKEERQQRSQYREAVRKQLEEQKIKLLDSINEMSNKKEEATKKGPAVPGSSALNGASGVVNKLPTTSTSVGNATHPTRTSYKGPQCGKIVNKLSLKPFGHDYFSPRWQRVGGLCMLSGVSQTGADRQVATMPSYCKPKERHVFDRHIPAVVTQRADIMPNGNVYMVNNGDKTSWFSYDGMVFPVDTAKTKDLALSDPWADYGEGYAEAGYYKEGFICAVFGLIKITSPKGVAAWGDTIGSIPQECRPFQRLSFTVNQHTASHRIDVFPTGEIRWIGGSKVAPWLSLDGIVFSVDPKPVKLTLDNNFGLWGGWQLRIL